MERLKIAIQKSGRLSDKSIDLFEKAGIKVWECRNCGHLVIGTSAPEVCPVCNHPQAYFEICAENY